MKKGDVWGLVSVLFIISCLALLFFFAPRTEKVAFQPMEVPGSALVLVESSLQGVVVDAVLGERGFVTLHTTIGDAPGPIIGTSDVLDVGMHSALHILSTQQLVASEHYVMLLIADDGDGVYEPGVDRPVTVDGKVIRVPVLLSPDSDALNVE